MAENIYALLGIVTVRARLTAQLLGGCLAGAREDGVPAVQHAARDRQLHAQRGAGWQCPPGVPREPGGGCPVQLLELGSSFLETPKRNASGWRGNTLTLSRLSHIWQYGNAHLLPE